MPEPPVLESAESASPKDSSARGARWIAAIAVLIALAAAGVAAWALLHPAKPKAPAAPTAQQVTDAKTRACKAYATVRVAVELQTHADLGTDPAAVQAVAANARLSMAAGGQYLLDRVDPATPAPLASAVRSLALDLQDIAMNALAGVANDDPTQAARLSDGQNVAAQVADLCK
jgi:hypothetical protein